MSKVLASFLMLVMLASALICGCGHEARAGTDIGHHYSATNDADHHHDGKGGTLSENCQKADMQLPAHTAVSKPDLQSNFHLDFVFADDQAVSRLDFASNRGIRGPPPWDDDLVQTQPSILLTTQRLRI